MMASEFAKIMFYELDPEDIVCRLESDSTNVESPIIARLIEDLPEEKLQEYTEEVIEELKEKDAFEGDPGYEQQLRLGVYKYVADVNSDMYEEAYRSWRASMDSQEEADRVSAHCKGYL